MGKKVGAAILENNRTEFRTWAPGATSVEVIFKDEMASLALVKNEWGYWSGVSKKAKPGSLYKYRLDGKEDFPDPASKSQPEGVHSWSQVVSNSFDWEDKSWKGLDLGEMIIYELHVGTFTTEGNFEAIIEKLDHLEELGVNTLELMPIAQFPGDRNWGYDGVYPFAAQDSYGGTKALKKLINECHKRNFAVLLDVVYNHFGPEGNYISKFGPYFTDKYQTPWGSALNLDDEYSDQVRNHFFENALMWLEEFHFDGLRLDAVHEIIDRGAHHFLEELSEKIDALEQKTQRKYVIIAESDLNDTRLIKDYSKGGYALEGQWVDDFHHSLHTVLTSEDAGYYKDYGSLDLLSKAYKQAFVYDGIYSRFRKKSVGNSPKGLQKSHFVVSLQNHDQVGNRVLGERIASLVSFEKLKLAAGVYLTSPFVPMLFMGEEFGETRPFQYFISHTDEELVKAVQEGRKKEFEYFLHEAGEFPDPQSEDTFERSKLDWTFKEDGQKRAIFEFYKELLRLKKGGAFDVFKTNNVQTETDDENRILKASAEGEDFGLFGIFNFGSSSYSEKIQAVESTEIIIASADENWLGAERTAHLLSNDSLKVPAESFVIYRS